MSAASTWSRLEAQQAAAERAAARAAKPKRGPSRKAPSGQLKTIDQLAAVLQISRSTVYRLVDLKGLPCIRIGAVMRFDLDEVMAWARGFTASGDRLRWQDDHPELQAQRAPTFIEPRRTAQPIDDAPARSAHAERRAEIRRRRLINPDLEGSSNGAN